MKFVLKLRIITSVVVSLITLAILFTLAKVMSDYIYQQNLTVWINPKNRTENYCETPLQTTHLIREPWNAYGSIFFIIPFCFVIVNTLFDFFFKTKSFLSKNQPLEIIFSILLLFHFIGTFTNHACSCKRGLGLDNMFMWLTLFYILGLTFIINVETLRNIDKAPFYIILGIVMILAAGLFTPLAFDTLSSLGRSIISGTLFLLISIFNIIFIRVNEMKINRKNEQHNAHFWIALVMLVFGLVFALLDSKICSMTNKFGSHSIFHILASGALTEMYLFLHSIIRY